MIHLTLIRRQLLQSKRQGIVFILCVTLSVISLIAIDGLSKSISQKISKDAKAFHGADIFFRSNDPMEAEIHEAVAALQKKGTILSAEYLQFYSVVLDDAKENSILAQLKVVTESYPLYGEVLLKSGAPLKDVLTGNHVVAEQSVLDQLGLKLKDTLHIGKAKLTIADVIEAEPDRPMRVFSLGPRIIIPMKHLKAMDLIQKGSRIRYVYLLKVFNEDQLPDILSHFKKITAETTTEIFSYKTAPSSMKRFFDNFFFFLKLVGVFIFLLSGIGIYRSVHALLGESKKSIAIMKTLGADSPFMMINFSLMILILGVLGTLSGTFLGLILQFILNSQLSHLTTGPLLLSVSFKGIFQGITLGIFGAVFFSFFPLLHLKKITPMSIFRHTLLSGTSKRGVFIFSLLSILVSFIFLRWQTDTTREGLIATAAIFSFILVASLFAKGALYLLKKISINHVIFIHAIKSLMRPGNATLSAIITLMASMSIIFIIFLLEKNLTQTFIDSYPKDAPNLYFIDIQPSEKNAFEESVKEKITYYPVVRAKITHVNDAAIELKKERQKKGDNLSRVFNLTFRDALLEDEIITNGQKLFQEHWKGPQVSIMDTIVSMKKMGVGDFITFKIQGVPLKARISSIRKQTGRSMTPFFYFVFPPAVLEKAPHTLFAAMNVPKTEIAPLRTKIVSEFPHITVIDLSLTIRVFAGFLTKLSAMVRLLSVLSILAGLLILISAVLATFSERIQEAVYYKILGAKSRFILLTFTLENLLIGFLSAIPAFIMAQGVAFYICHYQWEMNYTFMIVESSGVIVVTLSAITGIILLFSRPVITQKPAAYLREQHDE